MDAGVLVRGGLRRPIAARLDPRELELLAEDLGELLERDLDLEGMLAGLIAGLALTGALLVDRRAFLAIALSDAAGLLLAVAEARQIDVRQRNRDDAIALLAEHLAV